MTLTRKQLEQAAKYQKLVFEMQRKRQMERDRQQANEALFSLVGIVVVVGVIFLAVWLTMDKEPEMLLEEKTCIQYAETSKIDPTTFVDVGPNPLKWDVTPERECLKYETTYSTNPKWIYWVEREKLRQQEQQIQEEQYQRELEQYEEESYEDDDVYLGPNSL